MIRSKNASGTSRNGHTELKTPIRFLWAGHALVITRIDRLARSMRYLKDIVREPHEKGVHPNATEQPVDRRERKMEGIKARHSEWRVQRTAEVDQCCRGSTAS